MDNQCGRTVDVLDETNTIQLFLTSDAAYSNNMNCTLKLVTDLTKGFIVHVKELVTEPGYDSLYILDGNSVSSPFLAGLKGSLSGRQAVAVPFVTSGNTLTLMFTSDSESTDKGFHLEIESFIRNAPKTQFTTLWYLLTKTLLDLHAAETTSVNPPTTGKADLLKDVILVSCNENGWDVKLDMYNMNQIYPGCKMSDIFLGDNSCTGTLRWNTLSFNQGLRDCLTTEKVESGSLVYENELMCVERDPVYQYIIRHYTWRVEVECDIRRNGSLTDHIHYESVSNAPHVSGESHYVTNMSFYLDPNFLHLLPDHPLHLSVGQRVYVKVFTTGKDWTVKMRINTCYTNLATAVFQAQKYYLIENGCEVDANTHIISQFPHETKFSFETFEYTTSHEGMEVHCDVTYCDSTEMSTECSQTCNPVIS